MANVQFQPDFMTALGSLQMTLLQASMSFNESLDDLLGIKDVNEHKLKDSVIDVGKGVKAMQRGDGAGAGAVAGGIDAAVMDSLVKGKSLDTRSKPNLRLVGRQLHLGDPDETFHGCSTKRVICGVCHVNNEVSARTSLMECGHCGARNHAGEELAVRVRCYKCNASNIADPGSKTIKCASCSEVMDVPDEDDASEEESSDQEEDEGQQDEEGPLL